MIAASGRAVVRVKICGLNDAQGVAAAATHGADWIGFVFHPASPRFVTPEDAARLARHAPSVAQGGPKRVALLVSPDDTLIDTVCQVLQPDILQIYGRKQECSAIHARTGRAVWAAHGVASRDDLPDRTQANGLVIEAKPPAGADRPGGNGVAFDWTILRGWTAPAPWLLAGGLTPDNVATARDRSGAHAFDVSSGVETAPGRKSAELIARFIRAARSA